MTPGLCRNLSAYNADFILFAVVCLVSVIVTHLTLRKITGRRGIPPVAVVAVVLVLASALFIARLTGEREKHRMRDLLQGMAPTYAEEMRRMGHALMSAQTADNDPLYLSLIEAQKRWLEINPMLSDIYTFRRRTDGQVILMVDSETDYNRDGDYSDEREQRTIIGEPYADVTQNLKMAFSGETTFEDEPYADRWGVWVSAFTPIYDDEGKVEAVLGVDYPAGAWLWHVLRERLAILGLFLFPIMICLWATGAFTWLAHIIEIRRENEQSLAEAVKRFQTVVDLAPAGIFQTDAKGDCVYVNGRWCQITGLASKEALKSGWVKAIHPEDTDRVYREWYEAVSKKVSFRSDFRYQRPDGEVRYVSCHAVPITGPDGAANGYLGASSDVTEKHKAEEGLRQSEEAFRYTLLSAPVMIWMAQADESFIYVNRYWHEFTARPVKEELGDGWRSGVFGEDAPGLFKEIKDAFRERRDFKSEFRLRHRTGEYRWLSAVGTPRFRDDGSFAGYIGTCLDIHERKRLEALLNQAQKMETVGTLAGGIAHDLNNQLTPLSGYLDLVLKDMASDDPKRDLLTEAEKAAKRCAEVVQRLMNVTRASNLKKVWIDPKYLVGEVGRLLPKSLPATIRIETACDPAVWPVLANETEMQNVLMNMAVNSRDAMPEGGKLRIEAVNMSLDEQRVHPGFKPGSYVLFSVTDTGAGIPAADLTRIFEPFFTTKPKGKGTGLGLAMVFRVVRDHGGWVDVASEVGKGTMMQVYLPADPNAVCEKHPEEAVSQPLPKGSETILFADDEESLRSLGRAFLEKLGYKVLLAKDGQEAVDLYRKDRGRIDAVVLDMTMPKRTGKEVLREILSIDEKARVLLTSGFTAEGTARELIREGAMDFLPKPYTIYPLADALRKVLDRKV